MTLNTYSHLIPEDEDKAVDFLNNIKGKEENIKLQENIERTEEKNNKKPYKVRLYRLNGREDRI